MGLDRDQVSRHKKVVVQQHGDHVHEEHIVQDTNLELRQTVYKFTQLVWLLFGILEGLIGFRVILKLIAANPNNWFTFSVYQLTDFFLWPFLTITGTLHLRAPCWKSQRLLQCWSMRCWVGLLFA